MAKQSKPTQALLRWSEYVPASDVQDPLGLNLRGLARLGNRLLYCITSITPRARYFSFIPWCGFDYESREKGKPHALGLRDAIVLREKALTLACIAHHEGDTCSGGALVGTLEAKRWLGRGNTEADLKKLKLAKIPALNAYFTSLVNLGCFVTDEDALAGDEEGVETQFTFDDVELSPLGLELARRYDSVAGVLPGVRQLAGGNRRCAVEALAEFGKHGGLCELTEAAAPDRALLRDVFFALADLKGDSHGVRRQCLLLILELCQRFSVEQWVLSEPDFAGAVYFAELTTEEAHLKVEIPSALQDVASRWSRRVPAPPPAHAARSPVVLTPKHALRGHNDWIWTLAFSPDGRHLAAGADDRTVRVWGARAGQLRHVFKGHEQRVSCVTFAPDSKTLASVGLDPAEADIRLWDVNAGRGLGGLKGLSKWVWAVAFSPDGELLAIAGGEARSILLWDLKKRAKRHDLPDAAAKNIRRLAFFADGQTLASAGSAILLWDTKTGKLKKRIEHDQTSGLQVSSDGRLIAAAHWGAGAVALFDGETGKKLASWQAHKGFINDLALSPNGKLLASSGSDGFVRLWDTLSHEELATLAGHEGAVDPLAFSPDGSTLASGGKEDRTVRAGTCPPSAVVRNNGAGPPPTLRLRARILPSQFPRPPSGPFPGSVLGLPPDPERS
ncbi:MAG: WD40 repeat domain-containing protein [Gemmataceae bacterium]|nr:WD40 repeat domain-containing protein [Gemmataceae bacterium]